MQKYCYHCMKPLGKSPFCGQCGCDSRVPAPAESYRLPCGTVLDGRYIIGRALGEGGFGITYIGMDTKLAKRVAVKEYYPSGIASRDSAVSADVTVPQDKERFFAKGVERLLFEARSAAAFSDEEGIVNVQDSFQANRTAYLVMDYLDGENLKQYVEHHGVFSFNAIVALMMPVMKALKVMHNKRIIHCDISPDNMMLTKKGSLKLTDFGSAKYYTGDDNQKSVILKQGFAPLEQYRRSSDQRPYTDVYALCATIYYCITGQVPVPGPQRVPDDTLMRPSQLGADIRPSQEKALMRGMAVRSQSRTPDMETLIRELTRRNAIPGETAAVTDSKLPEQTADPAEGPLPESAPGTPEEPPFDAEPPEGPPASPNEYPGALKVRSGKPSEPPTRDLAKEELPPRHAQLRMALLASLSVLVIAGVAVVSVLLAGKSARQKQESAAQATTAAASGVDIRELLSGIETHPTQPSRPTTAPPATEPLSPITAAQATAHVEELKTFFFDNVIASDDRASYGNKIQLLQIYHSKRLGSDNAYIAFVHRNLTSDYYRVLYLSADRFYEDGGELKATTTYLNSCDPATTLSEATGKCFCLPGGLNFLYGKTLIYNGDAPTTTEPTYPTEPASATAPTDTTAPTGTTAPAYTTATEPYTTRRGF